MWYRAQQLVEEILVPCLLQPTADKSSTDLKNWYQVSMQETLDLNKE